MAARQNIRGGLCSMGCTDWVTGKPRKVPLNSKTGICPTCLGNLSATRRGLKAQGPSFLAVRRGKAQLALRRADEVEDFPKGYAVMGGRPGGKRK